MKDTAIRFKEWLSKLGYNVCDDGFYRSQKDQDHYYTAKQLYNIFTSTYNTPPNN